MIKFKPKNSSEKSIDKIMEDCEQYRKDLIRYCYQFFEYEYEYAEDCVQEAYVALLESLNNGVEIKNYKSWLYAVVLNYKNKVMKDKIKRNEFIFTDNEEKSGRGHPVRRCHGRFVQCVDGDSGFCAGCRFCRSGHGDV